MFGIEKHKHIKKNGLVTNIRWQRDRFEATVSFSSANDLEPPTEEVEIEIRLSIPAQPELSVDAIKQIAAEKALAALQAQLPSEPR